MPAKTPAPRAKGFRCSICAVKMLVIKTIIRASGIVARRRQCPDCGKRVTTEERAKGQN